MLGLKAYLVGEELLIDLTVIDLLFYGATGDEAVDSHLFLLSYPPCPLSSLHVGGGIPVGIKYQYSAGNFPLESRAYLYTPFSFIAGVKLCHLQLNKTFLAVQLRIVFIPSAASSASKMPRVLSYNRVGTRRRRREKSSTD